MKNSSIRSIVFFAAISLVFSSCDYGIKKNLVGTPKPQIEDCTVRIHKSLHPDEVHDAANAELVLTISLYDQMTTRCTEAQARAILRQEACNLGANWVNITQERYPGLLSSCYQCVADIYYVPDSVLPDLDYVNAYTNPNRQAFETTQRKNQKAEAWGWVIGFAIGFTATLLLLQ